MVVVVDHHVAVELAEVLRAGGLVRLAHVGGNAHHCQAGEGGDDRHDHQEFVAIS